MSTKYKMVVQHIKETNSFYKIKRITKKTKIRIMGRIRNTVAIQSDMSAETMNPTKEEEQEEEEIS